MKRLIALFLAAAMLLSVTACKKEKPLTYEQLIEKGDDCLDEEEYDDALDFYKQAVELDDAEADGYIGQAKVYVEQDKIEKAVSILEKGLKKADSTKSIQKMLDGINNGSIGKKDNNKKDGDDDDDDDDDDDETPGEQTSAPPPETAAPSTDAPKTSGESVFSASEEASLKKLYESFTTQFGPIYTMALTLTEADANGVKEESTAVIFQVREEYEKYGVSYMFRLNGTGDLDADYICSFYYALDGTCKLYVDENSVVHIIAYYTRYINDDDFYCAYQDVTMGNDVKIIFGVDSVNKKSYYSAAGMEVDLNNFTSFPAQYEVGDFNKEEWYYWLGEAYYGNYLYDYVEDTVLKGMTYVTDLPEIRCYEVTWDVVLEAWNLKLAD